MKNIPGFGWGCLKGNQQIKVEAHEGMLHLLMGPENGRADYVVIMTCAQAREFARVLSEQADALGPGLRLVSDK